MDCVGELNALLDVSHPWTWIVSGGRLVCVVAEEKALVLRMCWHGLQCPLAALGAPQAR